MLRQPNCLRAENSIPVQQPHTPLSHSHGRRNAKLPNRLAGKLNCLRSAAWRSCAYIMISSSLLLLPVLPRIQLFVKL